MNGKVPAIVIFLACLAWAAEVPKCKELTKDMVNGKILSVECCQEQANLKENGVITAVKDLKEAGCPGEETPANQEKEKMEGWQIAISFFLMIVFLVIIALIVRAIYRYNNT